MQKDKLYTTKTPNFKLNINGVNIPEECKCLWCGNTMRSGGARYMGAGINHFALWCDSCGAVAIHAKEFGKKISGFKITYEKEDLEK